MLEISHSQTLQARDLRSKDRSVREPEVLPSSSSTESGKVPTKTWQLLSLLLLLLSLLLSLLLLLLLILRSLDSGMHRCSSEPMS